MGDRAIWGFRDTPESPVLYLYSHWGGADQLTELMSAISWAAGRWNDPAYANRIATSRIIGEDWLRETGWGLSIGHYTLPDYETYRMTTWSDQTVGIWTLDGINRRGRELSRQSFEDFLRDPAPMEGEPEFQGVRL